MPRTPLPVHSEHQVLPAAIPVLQSSATPASTPNSLILTVDRVWPKSAACSHSSSLRTLAGVWVDTDGDG